MGQFCDVEFDHMWNLTGPKCKENAVSVIPVADHAPLPWCCFSVYSLMP